MFNSIAPWVQLGFAACMAAYLLMRTVPRMEDRAEKRDSLFLAALDKQHVEHKSELEDAREENERRHTEVVQTQEKIRERLHVLANAITKDTLR